MSLIYHPSLLLVSSSIVSFKPKRFVQSNKFHRFLKAEKLLFQSICDYYGNFTQALKETRK